MAEKYGSRCAFHCCVMKCRFIFITIPGRNGQVFIPPLMHLMGHAPLPVCLPTLERTPPPPGSPFLPNEHSLHFWDWKERKVVQEVNLGADGLIPLEVRVRGHSGEED